MISTRPGLYSLAQEIGPGWVGCDDALPWDDKHGLIDYVVYSPSYGGDMFVCRYAGSPDSWWSRNLGTGINGVTFWRLAQPDEKDFVAKKRQLPRPTTMVKPSKLSPLKRWKEWDTIRNSD